MENEEFGRVIRLRDKIRSEFKEDYQDDSRGRLSKISSKKIKTTMIGALSAIEKTFGFLWGLDENGNPSNEPLTDDELHAKKLYDKLRAEILDLGNKQIRNLEDELSQYTIEWNRYHIKLQVKPEGPTGGDNV